MLEWSAAISMCIGSVGFSVAGVALFLVLTPTVRTIDMPLNLRCSISGSYPLSCDMISKLAPGSDRTSWPRWKTRWKSNALGPVQDNLIDSALSSIRRTAASVSRFNFW